MPATELWKQQLFMMSFATYFITPTAPTNCYSNKYLRNDFRIIWTTIKCFASSVHVWVSPFAAESWKPIFGSEKLFLLRFYARLKKHQSRFMEMFPYENDVWRSKRVENLFRFVVLPPSTSCVGTENHFEWNAWQNVLCLSFCPIHHVPVLRYDEEFSSIFQIKKFLSAFSLFFLLERNSSYLKKLTE